MNLGENNIVRTKITLEEWYIPESNSNDNYDRVATGKVKSDEIITEKALFVKYNIQEHQQVINDSLIESGSIDVTHENYSEIQKLLYYLEIKRKYLNKEYVEPTAFRDYNIIENILRGYLRDEGIIPNLKGLLKNFWDFGLKTRSREKGREIIVMDLTKFNRLKSGNGWPIFGLLIIQTMKSAPNFEIKDGKIRRVGRKGIDKDNTYRYAYFFIGKDDKIYLIFNEKYFSSTFREWLGVTDILSYELLGVHFYLEKSGCKLKLELDEDEILNLMDRGIIQLSTERNTLAIRERGQLVHFNIRNIRLLPIRKDLSTVAELTETLKQRKAGIFHLRYVYERIIKEDFNGYKNPYGPKYRECEDKIIPIDKEYTIYKSSIFKKHPEEGFTSNKYILLSDFNGIEYDKYLLCKILRNIKNEEYMELIHVLLPVKEDGVEILPFLRIYNEITLPISFQFLNKIYNDEEVARSEIRELVKLAIIKSLSEIKEFEYFINSLFTEKIFKEIDYKIGTRIGKLEDKFVEYKRPDILYGNPERVAEHIFEKCVKNKLKESAFKLVIIGYDESQAKIVGINRGRAGHDHIRIVFERLKAKADGVFVSTPISVPADDQGFILVFYLYSESLGS